MLNEPKRNYRVKSEIDKEKDMYAIGFLGGGNMAEALIKGITSAGLYQGSQIIASDIKGERLEHLQSQYSIDTTDDNSKLAKDVEILVLSVKPQNIAEAMNGIKDALNPDVLIISIAAGIKTQKIADILGDRPIVRVMPNTPALIGEGAAALYANEKAKPMVAKAEKIFSSVGLAVVVEDEALMDSVTAVSGSGPAYFFLLIEEMINSGEELGLKRETAKELVLQTAKGATLLAESADKQNQTPAELRKKVTSPGGTTEAALKIFNQKGFAETVRAALKNASDRSRELSK